MVLLLILSYNNLRLYNTKTLSLLENVNNCYVEGTRFYYKVVFSLTYGIYRDSSLNNMKQIFIHGKTFILHTLYIHFRKGVTEHSWQSESKKDAYFWFCWHF